MKPPPVNYNELVNWQPFGTFCSVYFVFLCWFCLFSETIVNQSNSGLGSSTNALSQLEWDVQDKKVKAKGCRMRRILSSFDAVLGDIRLGCS